MPERAENGQLLPGHTANPEGKNGHLQGWQRYGARLEKWLALPPAEIAAYFENDGEKLKQLSSIDAVCVRHVSNMLTGTDMRAEREAGLDRIEGKPKQVVAHGGDPDNPMPISLDGVFSLEFGTDGNDSDKGTAPDPKVDKA
jgi:hypothetical protein